MFVVLSRKFSGQQTISELITNLKLLLEKDSIKEIIDFYPNSKLEVQKTFHIKLIKYRLRNNQFLVNQVVKNSNFIYMINDLMNDFEKFSIAEINDVLEFYRRSLMMGSCDFLEGRLYDKMLSYLTTFEPKERRFSPIISQTFYNFAVLGIQNPFVKTLKFNNAINIRCSEIFQLLKSMIINPYYFDEKMISEINQYFHLIFGKQSSNNLMKLFDNYLLVCELYNLSPDASILSLYDQYISQAIESNDSSSLNIFFFYNRERIKPFLEKYKTKFKAILRNSIKNPSFYTSCIKIAPIVFADNPDFISCLLEESSEIFTNLLTLSEREWKFKLLYSMIYCKTPMFRMFQSITFCFKHNEHKPRLSVEVLISSAIISRILGIEMPAFKDMPPIEVMLECMNIEDILNMMHRFISFDGEVLADQHFIDSCKNSIISRKAKSPNVANIVKNYVEYSRKSYNHELFDFS